MLLPFGSKCASFKFNDTPPLLYWNFAHPTGNIYGRMFVKVFSNVMGLQRIQIDKEEQGL